MEMQLKYSPAGQRSNEYQTTRMMEIRTHLFIDLYSIFMLFGPKICAIKMYTVL